MNHDPSSSDLPQSFFSKLRKFIFGPARDLRDPRVGHKISLIAFFAWVGLGADGLSSSAYGPEEAFRMLGQHTYLAVFLVLATVLTVSIISYSYSRIIEHFPLGGGGYVVATELLGNTAGVVSGSALIVDYILTITVSIAGGGDALFSLLPVAWQVWKVPVECLVIFFLIVMNLRGVKESVAILTPIFLTFIVTHAVLIFGGVFTHLGDFPEIAGTVQSGIQGGMSTLGMWGLFLIFLHAYSLGGGTYTGIEAISNGIGTLREPKVETGKHTMFYMALSLAFTAGGLLLCYMLFKVRPVEGQTLNAVLANSFFSEWQTGSFSWGALLVLITIASEAVLLLVAAQTGFIDGPRVMANMAQDSWLPRRFSALSDRLAMQNGVVLFGIGSLALLLYTGGHIGIIVVMYSVNVFLTFSMSQLGMMRFWYSNRHTQPRWKKEFLIHAVTFVLCFTILLIMIVEKFSHGAWVTILITSVFIAMCFLIKNHYVRVSQQIKKLDIQFESLPSTHKEGSTPEFDPQEPTAVILVGGYSGLGIHIFLNIFRHFPNSFKNVLFVSVGVVTSDFFKSGDPVEALKAKTEKALQRYVDFSIRMGVPARSEYKIGAEVVETASELCVEISEKYSNIVFFAGELVFEKPQWYQTILHNETAYAILRRIRFAGLPMVILPIRLPEGVK